MTANHWGFVIAAYGLVTLVLGGYWRHLVRQERLASLVARRPRRAR